eukprot:CAMPEP_0184870552 /NCGR_PEP_ID=MMETSP0580-20130426/37878_1 /TAXON_ID=1118495 /ORGANISM="Dactyliosolen fragilissimus" /LENGTH=225 /DNA_ID=CAMNT_0027372679 /DNA_START=622 /DNA_END=1296 /DNA_ORIENTATION=+
MIPSFKDKMKHPELTQVIGQPTYDTIKIIEQEIIANSQCTHTSLGGGKHRYLGLVKSPQQYQLISSPPFVKPYHLGNLNIPTGSTQTTTRAYERQHKQDLKDFEQCDSIEQIFKQQIMNALEHKYIAAIINIILQDIQLDIHQIFDYLFRTYGKVTPVAFEKHRQEVSKSRYDVMSPIDTLFSDINDLCDMYEKAGVTLTQAQGINIAYVLLVETSKFSAAIREW